VKTGGEEEFDTDLLGSPVYQTARAQQNTLPKDYGGSNKNEEMAGSGPFTDGPSPDKQLFRKTYAHGGDMIHDPSFYYSGEDFDKNTISPHGKFLSPEEKQRDYEKIRRRELLKKQLDNQIREKEIFKRREAEEELRKYGRVDDSAATVNSLGHQRQGTDMTMGGQQRQASEIGNSSDTYYNTKVTGSTANYFENRVQDQGARPKF